MKVDYVEETSVRKALTFEIEPEVVEKEIEEKAKDYAKRAKLPGFRPGKVPAGVIKKRFRGQVLEEALENIVNRVVTEALEGRGLRPVAAPRVTDLKVEEQKPLTFRAVFETLPLIELPEYRGLSLTSRTAQVSEEDVRNEIDRLREHAARYEPIEDRPSQKGDFLSLDISWTAPERGRPARDEDALLEVGSESNHPDLDARLAGVKAGDRGETTIEYPADYPAPHLAGQKVEYSFTVKGVKKKIVPPADDEFAKDLGEWETLAALEQSVKQRLLTAAEHEIAGEVKSALLGMLVDKASFEVPEALVERHMNARTESAIRSLVAQGVDPKKLGSERWKEYREGQREASQKAAKAELLLDEIARREGIEVLEAEIDGEIDRVAKRMGRPKAAVRRAMDEDGDLAVLRARIRESKTLDLLLANAKLDRR